MILSFLIYYFIDKTGKYLYKIIIQEFIKKIKWYSHWHQNQYYEAILLLEWILI
jgi:hypothetical protein